MKWWLDLLLFSIAFLGMEGVAWFTHKYVMHGFLWAWHKDHHDHKRTRFEKNDLFGVVFSIPAALGIILGTQFPDLRFLLPVGIGITGYGIFYIVFHDIIVHRRIRIKFSAKNAYLKRMIHAHYVHHTRHSKEGCEAFGFLYAPSKYHPQNNRK
jgi:beta-carotene 3-hydroxylase